MQTEQNTLREQFITSVRKASDLESVAAMYDVVIHLGVRVLTSCPCQDDATISLSLDHEQQTGRCWLCMARGDVFWLVMSQESVCFRDAVRILARRAGLAEPTGLTWTSNQLRHPLSRAEPSSRQTTLSLRSLQSPRRLRI